MYLEIQRYQNVIDEFGTCVLDVSGQWRSIYKVIVTSSRAIMNDEASFSATVSPPLYPEIVRIQGYKDPDVGAYGMNGGVNIDIRIHGVGRQRKTKSPVGAER